jgi:hypothetical protein
MDEENILETFEEFKDSYSYGTRSDMNFKFLKILSEDEASEFFKHLLWKLGDASNDGDYRPVQDHIYQWQVKAYHGGTSWQYEDAPFSPLRIPLTEAKLGLIATSGHFVAGDDPEPFGLKNMTQHEAQDRISEFLKAEPVLSSIPIRTPSENLRLRHGGYDIRAARQDHNCVLPIDHLLEFKTEGQIGDVADNVYSFVGAAAQKRLIKKSAPQWVEMLKGEKVDGMILVPV